MATYIEAIRAALASEMERDDRVMLLGQDIAGLGGAFRATKGLLEQYGRGRVINTPISESGTMGIAIGAAILGYRPVVEMQFADFVACGFNQIVNNAAKAHYRWGAKVPLVIRLPYGGNVSAGMFHSQCMEGWFASTPGLKCVLPSTVADARGLLATAIRDDDPVLFFEHKYLYRREKGDLPSSDHVVPFGVATTRRPGRDLTLVTWGMMVGFALEAAEMAAGEGVEVEVIDLRTLAPLDEEAILTSVRRTGRALIVHEATTSFGPGGELVARIADAAFEHLDAPVRRVAYPDRPVPYARTLENELLPGPEEIAAACLELARY